jgi:DNA helicase HerA-like ATPase/energy-coupling factor transporter ATP-binding protein EcfA2
MTDIAQQALPTGQIAAAFEHSITWEDDIWRADPVDVEQIHANARQKFFGLLETVVSDKAATPARILLFHGQSGAGKTHLIRALRTASHAREQAYFGYAQMTPDVSNYADYFLRRLIASLEKPYDPNIEDGESGLARLTRKLVADAAVVPEARLEELRDGDLDEAALAALVHAISDDIIASEPFAGRELDANIVRALLYLERRDPRIDQRVRHYLQGRALNELSQQSVAALDPNSGDGRAFEIIEALGTVMAAVDNAALVFCIDQVEDLRFFDDAEERFQRTVRDLIQIANRLPTALVIISCLEDFYGHVRSVVAQSYIDRIEKSGPVALLEARSSEEARLIIGKRLQKELAENGGNPADADPTRFFGPKFFEEFSGLSTRKLLEHAQSWLTAHASGKPTPAAPQKAEPAAPVKKKPERLADQPAQSLISSLAAALGIGGEAAPQATATAPSGGAATPGAAQTDGPSLAETGGIDYREIWDRFSSAFEAEMTSDDAALMDTLAASLNLAASEWGETIEVSVSRPELDEDLPVIDLALKHSTGNDFDARVFLLNRPTQGGGLKRQLEKALPYMDGRMSFMVRASDFPPNGRNQASQAYRACRDAGGRAIVAPISEWERMMTVREFYLHHRTDPGFDTWFAQAKLVSGLSAIAQILRLDLLGHDVGLPKPKRTAPAAGVSQSHLRLIDCADDAAVPEASNDLFAPAADAPPISDDALISDLAQRTPPEPPPPGSITVGHELPTQWPVALPQSIMKRHCAVLGGSGSGKTTLALGIIEQLLLEGIPAVLIDRKGDLASYANPDVWREITDEEPERRFNRERLADSIDVAVYTPGRSSGRPISITLLPSGINELPEHEQQLLANLSAAALGDMLHLKNSATHQKQSGTLSVALRILGSRSSREVMLSDLIDLLEEEDPELTDLTQRMDPSGKLRRDLVAQLDSLRHRNAALFDAGGENLRMESLLGLGQFAKPDRTRLSVIYTGFLGDNENILFWVAQFLSEALRFCQRNPNDELQAVVMFDEADLYIPANAKPATAEPLQSLLKRARSAGLGMMLATQSPGDLDYKSRDQITSWFIGRVREDTALRKLKAAFQSESGLDAAAVLPGQTVGEFHLVQEGLVRSMKAERSLIQAEQVPFDRIELLANETRGQDQSQLPLFGTR